MLVVMPTRNQASRRIARTPNPLRQDGVFRVATVITTASTNPASGDRTVIPTTPTMHSTSAHCGIRKVMSHLDLVTDLPEEMPATVIVHVHLEVVVHSLDTSNIVPHAPLVLHFPL